MQVRKNYLFKDYINNHELKLLNDNDKKIVINMMTGRTANFKFGNKFSCVSGMEPALTKAIYAQNHLTLKKLLLQKEETKKTNDKFDQLFEQNQQLINQNQEVINLLKEIRDK